MSSFHYQWPSILWAAIVLYLCTYYSDSTSGVHIPQLDKIAHFIFQLTLIPLVFIGLAKGRFENRYRIQALIIGISYGALVELLQASVFTWRSASWGDMLANTLGAAIGYLLCFQVHRLFSRLLGNK